MTLTRFAFLFLPLANSLSAVAAPADKAESDKATISDEGVPGAAAPVADDAAKADAKDEGFQRVAERAPRDGTPLIAQKLYPMQFRFELTGIFNYSFNDKYVQHTGGSGALTFHMFDWLAVEGFGGYLVANEPRIMETVRATGRSSKWTNTHTTPCANDGCEPQLPDMWMTTWFAGADLQWAPIYGKISAFSEYDLNFQLYGLVGGGAEGITKYLNNQSYAPAQVRLTANYGLGVRLIPWRYIALRAEVRNYNGLNPNVEEHDPTNEDKCKDGYTMTVGTEEQCFSDISNNTMLQLGLSVLFP